MRIRIPAVFGVTVAAFLILCLLQAAPAEAQYKVTAGALTVSTSDDTIVSTFCAFPQSISVRPDGAVAVEVAGGSGTFVFNPNGCAQGVTNLGDGGFSGQFVAYAPDGRRVYVADPGTDKLWKVDSVTGRVVGETDIFQPVVGDGTGGPVVTFTYAAGMALSPDGALIFIPGNQVKEMSVIDAADMSWMGTFPIADDNNMGAIALKWSGDPNARRVYLGGNTGYVSVYDGTSFELVTSFLIGEPNQDSVTNMAMSPDNARLYMATSRGHLLVLDTATNTIVRDTVLPVAPTGMALTPDGRHLYLGSHNSPNLYDIDALTGALVNTIAPGFFNETEAVGVGRLPFASMDASAALTSGLDAPFSMSGAFTLANGNAIDPLHEDVTIAVSSYVIWIPAGSFVEDAPGVFRRAGYFDPYNGLQADIEIRSIGANSYAFTIAGLGVDTTGEVLPLQALVVVGDDGGMAPLDLNAGLQQTVSSLQSDLSASQAQVASLTSQNNTLVQANADLNAQIEPLTQQVQSLMAQIQPLTDQVQTLTTLNGSLTTENVRLAADNAQLTTDKAQLTAANITLTTANQDLRARNATLSARNARLETELDAARQTIDNLRARIDDLRTTIQQKDARIDDLKAKLDAANATIETLRARIAALKNK